ncbi:MAG TPA: hypothetical protein P5533_00600 [Candidatus Cloacimonadota bacterium]|nr:hypothetical protein [Candidatus Cloacimonadota bacterium]
MRAKNVLDRPIRAKLGVLCDRIETFAVEAVEGYHAIATGKLRNSIHVKLEGSEAEGYQIVCYAEGSAAPYAQYVHEGREPGKMPPISPLMEWARKKMNKGGSRMFPEIGSGMVLRTRVRIGSSGRVSPNKRDITAFNAARQIAWAVARKIEKEGIPEKPFFVEAVRRALASIRD